ncbi:hypothetical protein KQX54_014747 [Cotesia glomerata]|uniref:Homeobox domain-containing protein n=1 Tax=Cotesia glomerata TaxID=32391 RepID=A0AAV7IRX5_COTGL|nr:hypothetical protein KQX54_014747 [Cotesia glomerata]
MERQEVEITVYHRLFLEVMYEMDRYPCAIINKQIAESFGLTKKQVKKWFDYNRKKERMMNLHRNIKQNRNCRVEEKEEDKYQNVNQDQNRQLKERREDWYQNVNPNLEDCVYSQAELNDIIDRLLSKKRIAESVGLTEKQVQRWFANRRIREKWFPYQNINQNQNCQVEQRKNNWYQNVNPNLGECVYHRAQPNAIIDRMKRQRVKITTDQRLFLEREFQMSRYICALARKRIAESVGLTEKQITRWFANRRIKEKWFAHQNINQNQNRQVEEKKEDSYQYFNQDQYRQVEERIEDRYQNVIQDHNRQVKESKEDSYQNVNPNLERRCHSRAELNDIIDSLLCTTDNSENCSSYQNFLSESYAALYFNTTLY